MGFIFYILVLLFSVIIHEVAHGVMAKHLGDDTAEMEGRLTLNPVRHIDPFGSILFPMFMWLMNLPTLGWARPVPYNPRKLYKDFRNGPLKVALVGPLSNIFLFILFALLARVAAAYGAGQFAGLLGLIAGINGYLAFFNLVPIPPLDGSKILPLILPSGWGARVENVGFGGIFLVLIFIYLFAGVISVVTGGVFHFLGGDQVWVFTQRAAVNLLGGRIF